VIVLDKANHNIQKMIVTPEMTEAQDTPEMTEAQDTPEMTEAQAEKERIKDLNQKKNYLKNKKVSFLAALKNSITH